MSVEAVTWTEERWVEEFSSWIDGAITTNTKYVTVLDDPKLEGFTFLVVPTYSSVYQNPDLAFFPLPRQGLM